MAPRKPLHLGAFFLLALTTCLVVKNAAGQDHKTAVHFFPYQVDTRKLPNGLDIVVIPTPEFHQMVTYSTAVYAGSRNETENGKTGLAHLFEHIMFRHQFNGQPDGYNNSIRRLGAFNNAWTNYDMTYYFPTTFTTNLVGPLERSGGSIPGLIELESSRFKDLKLDRKTFQVEAGAVLGEYRKNFSDPTEKMIEEMSPVAFPHHPYGHTVIGYREDVENMPEAWDAAWEFYGNYYKPNQVALIVVGDVDPNMIFAQAGKYYSDWKPSHPPEIPAEQAPQGSKSVHVDWDADVSPRLLIGYHVPAIRPGTKDTAVTQILEELLASRSAALYQRLRYQKQSVTDFSLFGGELLQATDPHLLLLDSELMLDRFKKEKNAYVADVQRDVLNGIAQLKTFSRSPGASKTLTVIKSKYRNDLLGSLDSTGNIARLFAVNYRFDRDSHVFDTMMRAIDSLTPADIDRYATKYFTPQRLIVTTLWHGSGGSSAPSKREDREGE